MAELGLEFLTRDGFDVKATTNRLGAGVRTYHDPPVFQDFVNQVIAAEIAGEGYVRWYRHDLSVPTHAVSAPASLPGADVVEAGWKLQLANFGL